MCVCEERKNVLISYDSTTDVWSARYIIYYTVLRAQYPSVSRGDQFVFVYHSIFFMNFFTAFDTRTQQQACHT